MDFLIFSDSHGKRRAMETAIGLQIKKPDAIFFLGDGLNDIADRVDGIPVICVRGNCDWSIGTRSVREEETVSFEGHRIFLTHGHRYAAKSGLGAMIRAAEERGADVVLYGHTHRPALETIQTGSEGRTVTFFNPGSIAEGSFGTLTLTSDTVLFSHGTI